MTDDNPPDDLADWLTAKHTPPPQPTRADRIHALLADSHPRLAEAFMEVLTGDMPARTIERRMREIAHETGLDVSISDTAVTTWRLKNGHHR